MKTYACTDYPLVLHGLHHIDAQGGDFWRLPPDMLDRMPQYAKLGRRCAGARLRFATDSPRITVRYSLHSVELDVYMGLPASSGIDVYYGVGVDARFGGIAAPSQYSSAPVTVEQTFKRPPVLETVTVNLPRNDLLKALEIDIEENAAMQPPEAYRIQKPLLFYGSSITEGGCAPRPGCAYTSMAARWLDADYYNYGFSGSARGELEFAHFIAARNECTLLVYDYDHNAPTPEALRETHKAFFCTIRKAHPDLPVLLMSRPDFDRDVPDSRARRDIVRATYDRARQSGDGHVYCLDGQTLFGREDRQECTIDGCHPTALGFIRMAKAVVQAIEPII